MKKLVSLFAVIALISQSIPVAVSAQTEAAVSFNEIKTGVANISMFSDRVEGDFELEGLGTGFFIDATTLVTAAHVITPSGGTSPSPFLHIAIEDDTFKDHQIGAFGKVVGVDKENDLAVVKVIPMPFDKKELRQNFTQHHVFRIATQEPDVSDGVRIIGYPDITEGEISLTSGIISSLDESSKGTVFFSDVQASFGNSGGPAINEANEVVGVVTQIASSQANNSQLTRIVSYKDHEAWFNELRNKAAEEHHISVDFYNFIKELDANTILDNASSSTHTVTSEYYPGFSLTIPQGYDFFAQDRKFFLRNASDEIESVILTVPLPATPVQDDLLGVVANLFDVDVVISSVEEGVTIAGLMGIRFEELNSGQLYYALSHENSVVLIVGDIQSASIQSLVFTPGFIPSFDPNQYNAYARNIFFQLSKDYYVLDSAQGSAFIYRKSNVYDQLSFISPMQDLTFDQVVKNIGDNFENDSKYQSFFIESEEYGVNKYRVNYYERVIKSAAEETSMKIVVFENPTEDHDPYMLVSSANNLRYSFPAVGIIQDTLRFASQIPLQTFNLQAELDHQNQIDGVTQSDSTTPVQQVVTTPSDPTLAREDLKGYILLQVQQHGEAWYINPVTRKRIYMRDGKAAFTVMRKLGLGITNADLNKITIGTTSGDSNRCTTFSRSLAGKVLLQVEENGEAWYIYPKNCRRYSLGRPDKAYEIMRTLGLGAIDADIIAIGEEAL